MDEQGDQQQPRIKGEGRGKEHLQKRGACVAALGGRSWHFGGTERRSQKQQADPRGHCHPQQEAVTSFLGLA